MSPVVLIIIAIAVILVVVLIAGMLGFTKREFFDAEPEAEAVPNVDLSLS